MNVFFFVRPFVFELNRPALTSRVWPMNVQDFEKSAKRRAWDQTQLNEEENFYLEKANDSLSQPGGRGE